MATTIDSRRPRALASVPRRRALTLIAAGATGTALALIPNAAEAAHTARRDEAASADPAPARPTGHPDAALLVLCHKAACELRAHRRAEAALPDILSPDDADAWSEAIDAFSERLMDIEDQMIAIPAVTLAGFVAKARVVAMGQGGTPDADPRSLEGDIVQNLFSLPAAL
ncbi:MAG: hypothetical protein AAF311_11315 [Pseudomonadota bacterium]